MGKHRRARESLLMSYKIVLGTSCAVAGGLVVIGVIGSLGQQWGLALTAVTGGVSVWRMGARFGGRLLSLAETQRTQGRLPPGEADIRKVLPPHQRA